MELLDYNDTLQNLKEFDNIDLKKLTNVEVVLEKATLEDLMVLYKALESTRKNLQELKNMLS